MDYGYLNARIRGMKGHLLDRKALDELILRPDIDSLIEALEKTPYKDDIAAARIKYSGIYLIEYALRENFTRTFKKIRGFLEGDEAGKYLKVLLQRWDVQNVKTILRGKGIHATPEEIFECLLPIGYLDEDALAGMIKQPDTKSVIDLMAAGRNEYARPLKRAFGRYSQENDPVILEIALDAYHYTSALDSLGGQGANERIVRDLLMMHIDIINIKTALRMVRDSIDAEEAVKLFLKGGKMLDRAAFRTLVSAKSMEEALKHMEGTRYDFLKCAPDECVKKAKISDLEKLLDRYMIRKGIAAYRIDPLSIGVLLGYFWAKYNEVTNLRIISRCKTAGMTEEKVKEELIYA